MAPSVDRGRPGKGVHSGQEKRIISRGPCPPEMPPLTGMACRGQRRKGAAKLRQIDSWSLQAQIFVPLASNGPTGIQG